DRLGQILFATARSEKQVLWRMYFSVTGLSAFMNNTPIVAMFIPMVRQFALKIGVAPSKMLMPLAFATMFGGTCTLVGTSSNLIISSQLERSGLATLGMLEIGKIGVPSTILGILYLVFVGRHLLPARKDLLESVAEEAREYLAEVEVKPEARIVGQKVEAAGLRHLDGLFLIELRREDGHVVRPVAPHDRILAGDHLVFSGEAGKLGELLIELPGLVPSGEVHLGGRGLFEVVISHRSAFVGNTVKEADFRRRVDAAILAVHRAGERIEGQIGEIVLQPGDTLLLSASPGFYRTFRNSALFYMVSAVPTELPSRADKANLTLVTLLGLVVMPAAFGVPMLVAAMAALLVLLVVVQAISPRAARASVSWNVLVLIGSAFGIAHALESTGAASALGRSLVDLTQPLGPRATLATVYVLGVVFASFISNAAAAALLFPIAATAATAGGNDVRPFAIALAMAASAGFSTPIGCQPNLLVYGPGAYRYGDFTRVGLPLNLMFAVVAITFVPWIWPF
ncbi:MAG: SLC13 family permease, partial [Myxococcales bacterium]|nr:SLC13 family permease [Myxococcales bacterium]